MAFPVKDVFIYAEPRCPQVDFGEIAGYVRGKLPGTDVELRGPFLESMIDRHPDPGRRLEEAERISGMIARARVTGTETSASPGREPLPGEVEYEKRRLKDRNKSVFGLLYDAHLLADCLAGMLDEGETGQGSVHVVFTNQLIGTWDSADNRYHARVVLCGSPSIVSTSGVVAAPARNREYYLVMREMSFLGMPEPARRRIAGSYAGDCMRMDDERMTGVLKGYVMQAVVYRMTGEPFCEDRRCRLFNAHWQSEMLAAQLGSGPEYCQRHESLLENLSDMEN